MFSCETCFVRIFMDLFLSAILCFNTKLIREKKGCKQADHSELIAFGKKYTIFLSAFKEVSQRDIWHCSDQGGGNHSSEILSSRKNLKYTSLTPLRANLKCGGRFFCFLKIARRFFSLRTQLILLSQKICKKIKKV